MTGTTDAQPLTGPKVLIAAGGGHITEVEMIKGLRAAGIDIHAAFESDSPLLDDLKAGGVPTRTLDLRSNIDWRNARRIREWIKNEGFDIVHGLANRQVANFIWASYGLPNKVIAYRGAVGHVSRWDPTCYLKWLNPRIDRLICVSRAVQRDLATNGVRPDKLITIYKGHELSWYANLDGTAARRALNAEFNIPAEAIVVGMAGNMRRVKGADILLRAMYELPENIHGVFIGEVRDAEITTLANDSRLSGRVHFTGFRADAPTLIGALDINTAPSRGREGLTKTVIEGLAQGIPTVTSDAAGLAEMIEDGVSGLQCRQDSVEDFVTAIQRLADDPALRERLGRGGIERVRDAFDLKTTIEKTKALYEELTATE